MKENLYDELFEENKETNKENLQETLLKYLAHWQWFALSVILCLTCTWFYLRYATWVYEITATVMINDEKKGGRNTASPALEELGFMSSGGNIDNEIEILKSKSLIQNVVSELNLYAAYLTKGRIGERDLYTDSPVIAEMNPEYLHRLREPIELEAEDLGQGKYRINGEEMTLPATLHTPQGDVQISARPEVQPLPGQIIYITLSRPINMAKGYLGALTVEATSKTTSIALITLKNSNPKRGEDFINKLVELYNRDANNDKNLVAQKTAGFIDERIDIINRELDSTEKKLENFKRDAGLTDISTDAQLFLQENSEYEKKSAENNMQINLVEYLKEYIEKNENKYNVIPANVGLTDIPLSGLIKQYNEQVLEYKRLKRGTYAGNPALKQAENSLDAMHATLGTSINSLHKGLLITRADLARQTGKYSGRIRKAPEQERELAGIARQQSIKSGLFLMLLQKREENAITLATTVDNARIVDAPIAGDRPVSPQSIICWLIALILGFVIPVVYIYIAELLRFKISGREDVEKLTPAPITGEIPFRENKDKEENDIAVKENDNNLMSEVFRSLRTNLQFILGNEGKKVILVTSTSPGEGKTTIAANLGMSLALLGKKVLIIGLDIRKPRLAEAFGIHEAENRKGITAYLSNPEDIEPDELILPSGTSGHLSLLPAGAIPPNPAELLSRESLGKIIGKLRSRYDYILIDSAPVGSVTDTLIIAHHADVTLYVCRAGYTFKSAFGLVNELEKKGKLPHLSLVINAVKMKVGRYGYGKYGYGHKYGYGYGYGYGNENRNKK